MATSAKARQPRLRASCDGCFLAKVKCSKTRPICSRCLACGIVCNYSPSSRAGKPKPDHNHTPHSSASHEAQLRSLRDDNAITFHPHAPPEHMFSMDAGWATPPTSVEASMNGNTSLPTNLSMAGIDESTLNHHGLITAPPDLYSSTLSWGSSTDLACAAFADLPVTAAHMQGSHARSHSFDALSMPMQMAWGDPKPSDIFPGYSQVQTPTSMTSNYFPSPTPTPIIQSTLSCSQNSGSCTCFALCLQSLLALHNTSTHNSVPFDLVLSVNQRAVEGCNAMLACTTCFSRPGVDTLTMLLATIISKVASFYKSVTHAYPQPGTMAMLENTSNGGVSSVSIGTYQLNRDDGSWLKTEILARELRKLEEVFVRFREIYPDVFDAPEFSKALIDYIGQNISSTLDGVIERKMDTNYPG
ncbi:hypothetical protein F5Y14DRAFT_47745 [Nemania sp. NC0429]|nr:hypothetical protein F5Y14DRAFT_47745 [Nemania sp. NC0429]